MDVHQSGKASSLASGQNTSCLIKVAVKTDELAFKKHRKRQSTHRGRTIRNSENSLDQNMAEVIYTTPNMARNTQGEREERIVEIYATTESLGDQHQDYVGTEESSNTLGTVRSQQPDPVSPPRCQIRAVVVLNMFY